MTRFAEISPLWQHLMNLCQMVEGLVSVWQIFEPTLAKLLCFGLPVNVDHGQKLMNDIAIWSLCLPLQIRIKMISRLYLIRRHVFDPCIIAMHLDEAPNVQMCRYAETETSPVA